jgi:hypothetical protein
MPKVEDNKHQESRINDGRTYDHSVKIEDVGAGGMPDSPPLPAPFRIEGSALLSTRAAS